MVRLGRSFRLPSPRTAQRVLRQIPFSETAAPDVPVPVQNMPDTPGFHLPDGLMEPVHPFDCDRWPTSPFCDHDPPGIPSRPFRPIRPPAGFNPSNSGRSGCEAWIYVAPSLFGVGLPGTWVNFRIPGCVDPPPEPPPPPPPPPPLAPGLIIPPDMPNPLPEGQIPRCQYFALITVKTFKPVGVTPYVIGESSLTRVWDRLGSFEGMVLPVYGPILGLKHFFSSDGNGGGELSTFLECGGGGVFNSGNTTFASTKVDGIEIVGGYNFALAGWMQWVNSPSPNARGPSGVWQHSPGVVLGTDRRRYYLKTQMGTILYPVMYQYRAWNQDPFYTFAFHDIRRAADIAPWRGYIPWGQRCMVHHAPPPPPPPRNPPPDDEMCNCNEQSRMLDYKLRPIYKFLQLQEDRDPLIRVSPEDSIKAAGRTVYSTEVPGAITVRTLSEMLAAVAAPGFHRGGMHRLPAKVPKMITADREDDDQIDILDLLSWHEWEFRQLDAILGQFPIKIDVTDDGDNTSTVEFKNLAEGLAEIAGLLLGTAADADLAANLALRATLEASKAGNAAIIGQDYTKAIAEYLGFKGNEIERKVRSTITPGATAKDELLTESEQKIPGYKWDGTESFSADLRKLLMGVGIIKAALVQAYKPGDKVTGDAIREAEASVDNPNSNARWAAFLTARETPPERRQVANAPTADITDLNPPPTPPGAQGSGGLNTGDGAIR